MAEQQTVRVGQVWADNDRRAEKVGREVKVVVLHRAMHPGCPEFAMVVTRFGTGPWGTRQTRIRLNRFRPTSTGYRLVTDVEVPK